MKYIIYKNGKLYTRGWVINRVFDSDKAEDDKIYQCDVSKIPFKDAISLIFYTGLAKKSIKMVAKGFRIKDSKKES